MPTEYHHGVRVFEVEEGGATIRVISTAIIGLIATAPLADPDAFPLNTPVLLTNPGGSIGKAGATGTLAQSLKAIAQQAQAVTIVVRVEPGANAAETTSNVIGTTTATGQKTGLQALLAAQGQLGYKPRIIGAPGLDTEAVAIEIGTIAEALRGFGYVAARKADGLTLALTKEDATLYRAKFGKRELMIIWPEFLAWNVETDEAEAMPATAYALGLRAKIDQQIGWHKTLSNVVVNGPQGMTADVFFDLQSPSSDTTYLNSLEVTTIINRSGFRFWGNRTAEAQGGKFFFENYTRTAQVLADTIAEAHFTFVDKPIHPTLVKDMLANINAKGRDLVNGGYLIGFEAFLNPDLNPKEELAQGRLRISYRYTPVPPLEDLGFNQTITDDFLANFAAAVQAA